MSTSNFTFVVAALLFFVFAIGVAATSPTTLQSAAVCTHGVIGLRELHESGRLHLLRKPGRHLSFNRSFFEDQIARRFLSDELPP